MAQKIVHWLLITLILSLGFGQLLRFEYFGIPIYLHDLLVVCILILQGQALKVKSSDLRGLALLGTGLLIGWIRALTIYPVADLLIPSLYTFRLLAYLALYFVLKKTKLSIPRSAFIISGLTTLVIGLAQYFFMPDMRIFQYLGWDDHLNRLTLPHFDPTFTAVMLGLFVLTLKRSQWFFGLTAAWSILLTYSRSVWISLTFTMLLTLKSAKYLILTSCIIILAVVALPRRFGEGTNLLRTYSITSRFEGDLASLQKYKWDLLIGRGMNTLLLDAPITSTPNHAASPNNSYLYLLLTSGFLGLMGWGMFLWSLFQKSAHKPMLVFFFIASLFNNVMFYPFALLWVLLIQTTENKT